MNPRQRAQLDALLAQLAVAEAAKAAQGSPAADLSRLSDVERDGLLALADKARADDGTADFWRLDELEITLFEWFTAKARGEPLPPSSWGL